MVAKYSNFKKSTEDISLIAEKYSDLNSEWKHYARQKNRAKRPFLLNMDAFEKTVEYFETL